MFRLIYVIGITVLAPSWLLAQISGQAKPIVEAALKAAGGEVRLANLKAAMEDPGHRPFFREADAFQEHADRTTPRSLPAGKRKHR